MIVKVFSVSSLLFLVLWVVYIGGGVGQIVTWTKEHQQCTKRLLATNEQTPTYCEDLPYVGYFKTVLSTKGVSEYHTQIANSVLRLYSDLKELTKPFTFVHPHNTSKSFPIHPVSFCIPEENILSTVPHKLKAFGRVIPGVMSTYYHLYNESQYFDDMSRSLFTLTYKKGGWDCLRHYEILAAGSLPLFVNIRTCPTYALALHPKRLYALLLSQPGLDLQATKNGPMTMHFDKLELELSKVDPALYSATVSAMLHYTRNVLSTRGMAEYVLETMYAYSQGRIKSPHPKSLLYLTHQDHDMDKGDYMTDFLLHGMKKLLGENSVTDFPARDALYKTLPAFNTTNYLAERLKLYGSGFSWGMKIDVLASQNARNRDAIQKNLMSHTYDLVILGSGHRDGWASRLWFWDLVCKYYHPLEVGFVDGADYHLRLKTLDKYSTCAGHIFSREGYSPNHK